MKSGNFIKNGFVIVYSFSFTPTFPVQKQKH